MSLQEFQKVFDQIGDEKWQEHFKPTIKSYTEFEISLADSQRFLQSLQGIIPQIYASLQYQLKDPKLDNNLRKDLAKRAMKLEKVLIPHVDLVWKLSSKLAYEAMVTKITDDRKKKIMEEMKKVMVEKMKNE